jgi:hypothetical protein
MEVVTENYIFKLNEYSHMLHSKNLEGIVISYPISQLRKREYGIREL